MQRIDLGKIYVFVENIYIKYKRQSYKNLMPDSLKWRAFVYVEMDLSQAEIATWLNVIYNIIHRLGNRFNRDFTVYQLKIVH